MAVQPTQPDRIGGSDIGRARRSRPSSEVPGRTSPRAPASSSAPGDSIQISSAAGEIRPVTPDYGTEEGDLTPERLRQVLGRISEGFYLRPEVRAEVARKLAKVLADS